MKNMRFAAFAALAIALLGSCGMTQEQKIRGLIDKAFGDLGPVLLDLSNQPFEYLPDALLDYDCARIQTLMLSRCGLLELPEDFASRFPSLVELRLDGNSLKSLPPGMEALADLRFIDVSGNALSAIPGFLRGSPRLRILNLSRNDIRVIGDSLDGAADLENLYLGANEWLSIDDIALCVSKHAKLTYLDLSRLVLTTVPVEILSSPALVELDLSFNYISALPPFASSTLVRIDLGSNEIADIPDLSACPALKQALFGSNPLRTLEPSRLPESLEVLDLTNTVHGRDIKAVTAKALPRLGIISD